MQTILDFIIQNWIFLAILLGSLLAIVSLYFVFNLKPGDRTRKDESPKNSNPPDPAEPQGSPDLTLPVFPIVRDGEILSRPLPEIPHEEEAVVVFPEPSVAVEPVSVFEPVVPAEQPHKPKKPLGKYHVLYRSSDDSWIVKREGSDRILRVLETQKDAIAFANIKALTNETQIVIHKKDGKIRKQNYRKGDED